MEALLRGEEEDKEGRVNQDFDLDTWRREQRGQGRIEENGELEVRGGASEDWVPGHSSEALWKENRGPRLQPNTQPKRQEAEFTVMHLGVCKGLQETGDASQITMRRAGDRRSA